MYGRKPSVLLTEHQKRELLPHMYLGIFSSELRSYLLGSGVKIPENSDVSKYVRNSMKAASSEDVRHEMQKMGGEHYGVGVKLKRGSGLHCGISHLGLLHSVGISGGVSRIIFESQDWYLRLNKESGRERFYGVYEILRYLNDNGSGDILGILDKIGLSRNRVESRAVLGRLEKYGLVSKGEGSETAARPTDLSRAIMSEENFDRWERLKEWPHRRELITVRKKNDMQFV